MVDIDAPSGKEDNKAEVEKEGFVAERGGGVVFVFVVVDGVCVGVVGL